MSNPIELTERIIDVNLNRLTEGIKVIEDIIRFYFKDQKSLIIIRNLKKELWQNITEIRKRVIRSRNSQKDFGRTIKFDKIKRTSIVDVFSSNIKRCQESARVLEEIFKLDNQKIVGLFKRLRFELYDLEKDITKQIVMTFDPKLYVIIDIETIGRKYLSKIAQACILGGATMIQLREPKETLTRQWLIDARKIKKAITNTKVKLIINDRIDIALAVNADGTHLGKYDMPLSYARRLLPDDKIIGCTVRNLAQAQIAQKNGADYLGVGAIFPSPTKPTAPVIGIKRLKPIIKNAKIPVIAIGGIDQTNAKQLFKLGVAGVAITSAVFKGVNFKNKNFDRTIIKNLQKITK